MKRYRSDDRCQLRFKKCAPNKDSSSAPKACQERSGGSQFAKPTCTSCGKRHYRKHLECTSGCYGFWKNNHMVKDCPTLVDRGRKSNKHHIVARILMIKRRLNYVLSNIIRKQILMKVSLSYSPCFGDEILMCYP